MSLPLTKKKAVRRRKKLSQKRERKTMDALGARLQAGSGAPKGHKGDGRIFDKHRVEHKYTEAMSYSLKLQELWKINAECEGNERPLFVIDFLKKGTGKLLSSYVVIPMSDFERMKNATSDD